MIYPSETNSGKSEQVRNAEKQLFGSAGVFRESFDRPGA